MSSLNSEWYNLNVTNPIGDDGKYNPPTRVARYQIGIAATLGLIALLMFSILRVRYPKIYVANFNYSNAYYPHSSGRRFLPKLPEKSLFGWIPVVFKVSEDQILQNAGLDAVVFLEFFKMSIRILGTCLALSLVFIFPIRYMYTGKLDQDYNVLEKKKGHDEDKFLWLHILFTYLFTLFTTYLLFKSTSKVIKMRQNHLGKQNSITDKTIKVSGIPPFLRDPIDLKRYIEKLSIGDIESIVIVKEWNELNHLFNLRQKVLRKIELYWVDYFRNNGVNISDLLSGNLHLNLGDTINMGSSTDYSDNPWLNANESQGPMNETASYGHNFDAGSSTLRNSDREEVSYNASQDTESRHSGQGLRVIDHIYGMVENSLSPEDSIGQLSLLNDELGRRPQIRNGFMGLFGEKVDAINYWSSQLNVIDSEIIKARVRDYPATSSAFITMNSVAQAQMLAQAVLEPKLYHLITSLAPAPHDVIWNNLCLTRRERNTRIFFVTVIIGVITLLLIYPVRFLANFLNVKSISKVSPHLGDFLKKNKWAESVVTGLVPYIFTIFNNVMPHLYVRISRRQGFTSHSDEELSSVSKNFFYIFVNLFLVFTLFGTASLSDTTQIASQLASSLRELSLFYVDLIILQGIGIFPYKLLLLGNLIKYSLGSLVWCKTPRDYLKLYKPPVFDFGIQLPQPILILIIALIYSLMSLRILTAGVIYFLVGYFVCKYQLLYACVHPPHSTGRVWPLIFRRVILGLILFQVTMVGTLALQKDYVYASFMIPLPIITLGSLWIFQQSYIPLSIFIALNSLKNPYPSRNNDEENLIDHNGSNTKGLTLDERRESNQTYEYPHSVDSLDGPVIAIEKDDAILVNTDGLAVRKSHVLNLWE